MSMLSQLGLFALELIGLFILVITAMVVLRAMLRMAWSRGDQVALAVGILLLLSPIVLTFLAFIGSFYVAGALLVRYTGMTWS